MDKREPTLVPEWYKASTGGSTNSNHHASSSSHSDEHGSGHSTRGRLTGSSLDHESPRSSSFSDRSSSSFRRSTSSNGSLTHDKDSSGHSRAYSSFGRSHRDRDRDKDLDRRDRDRSLLPDNGLHDSFESLVFSRNEKDTLRRSRSLISGKRGESWPKRPGDLSNGILSGGSVIGGIGKTSFERDFPSLGAEEKQGPQEIVRVSSPLLSTTVPGFPIGTSPKLGTNGWTSALVVPGAVGNSGPAVSSTTQNATVAVPSTASSTMTGLNMAETLAQAPSRVRTEPQLSIDTHKMEELARRQCAKLVPLTPSVPKSSASEKSKPKGTRGGELGAASKVGQQSSQLTNNTLRAPTKPDALKTSPAGNFQILNREKNGISPTAKDGQSPMNANRVVNPLSVVPSAASNPLKGQSNPKLKVDGKGGALPSNLNSLGEKRPHSQAQNRNDFFNSLRKKSSMNHASTTPEPMYPSQSCGVEKSGEEILEVPASATPKKESSSSAVSIPCSAENGNGDIGGYDSCEAPESLISDNEEQSLRSNPSLDPVEEAALLHTLGWEENGAVEPLTEEEIVAFAEKYKQLKPSSKLDNRVSRVLRLLNPSDYEPEA